MKNFFFNVFFMLFSAFISSQIYAHEKTFPTRQLAALTPDGLDLTFKETTLRPASSKIAEFEKKYNLVFTKGELAGNLYMGSSADRKSQIVVVFLDGKSERGDTEFGAAVNTQGRVAKIQIFSSSEPGATKEFAASLSGKSADDLVTLIATLNKSPSEQFLAKLTLKALGRVSASFK